MENRSDVSSSLDKSTSSSNHLTIVFGIYPKIAKLYQEMTTGMSNRIIILPHCKTSSPSNILESPPYWIPFIFGRKEIIFFFFQRMLLLLLRRWSKIGRRLLWGGGKKFMVLRQRKDAEKCPIHWDFFVKTQPTSNLRRFALVAGKRNTLKQQHRGVFLFGKRNKFRRLFPMQLMAVIS